MTDEPSIEGRVRVFLSWSGERSRLVATALADGLRVLSARLEPWLSEDLEPGAEWANTLIPEIRKADLAVLCLTHRNAGSSWISFEAGAYYSSGPDKAVIPYLLDLTPAELALPLGLFQGLAADQRGTRALVTSVGEMVGLDAVATDERFITSIWPPLDARLAEIRAMGAVSAGGRIDALTNIANAFFLGHDLRWTMDNLEAGAAVDDVKHGLAQTLHQARQLGLGGHDHFLILQQKARQAIERPVEEWTPEVREQLAVALQLAFERIGGLVIGQQKDYQPYDPENQQSWLAIQADNRA